MSDSPKEEKEFWSSDEATKFVQDVGTDVLKKLNSKILKVPKKQRVLLYGRIINLVWASFYSPILLYDNENMLQKKDKNYQEQLLKEK